jgi:hypothetical protein
MNLTELQQEVYGLTNRPTLVAETLSAVRAATLELHQEDFYPKDLFETGIVFSAPAYVQQIDYRAIIPRWRAFKYLRKTDITGTEQGEFFNPITPEEVLDDYKLNRDDVCYLAGSVIQIRSSTELQYSILGCYLNPDITALGFNSWIAQDHPYAIIYKAASIVFKAIGQDTQFAAYTKLVEDQKTAIMASNIQMKGY